MNGPFHHPEDEFQAQLQGGVVEELRSLYGGSPSVPAERNRLIISSARAQFAKRRRMRLVLRVGGAVAAAAVVLIAVMVLPERSGRVEQTPTVTPMATRSPSPDQRDLNTDGSVDILDAYLLAKHVERQEAIDRAFDLNQDGKVDRSDADSLASAVVTLPAGGTVR